MQYLCLLILGRIFKRKRKKKWRSHITCLTEYHGLVSHEWLFIASGVDAHTHSYIPMLWTKAILRNQIHTSCMPGFKNCMVNIQTHLFIYCASQERFLDQDNHHKCTSITGLI